MGQMMDNWFEYVLVLQIAQAVLLGILVLVLTQKGRK